MWFFTVRTAGFWFSFRMGCGFVYHIIYRFFENVNSKPAHFFIGKCDSQNMTLCVSSTIFIFILLPTPDYNNVAICIYYPRVTLFPITEPFTLGSCVPNMRLCVFFNCDLIVSLPRQSTFLPAGHSGGANCKKLPN